MKKNGTGSRTAHPVRGIIHDGLQLGFYKDNTTHLPGSLALTGGLKSCTIGLGLNGATAGIHVGVPILTLPEKLPAPFAVTGLGGDCLVGDIPALIGGSTVLDAYGVRACAGVDIGSAYVGGGAAPLEKEEPGVEGGLSTGALARGEGKERDERRTLWS
ncbi:hypothetical protein V495_01874 [Pseudogymnoascus sp. VKM F-4514 (FW-929)]|nr:hypothetical protein V495_01874 [Pseudogymnoascus sp. VKM F-4514 (FW-929)]